ncbi:MAG TPA: hypothetical protein VFG39_02690, partial [Balneolaceae bacterium]|nr:hypothetical protein [Balneolaceae bacterium]
MDKKPSVNPTDFTFEESLEKPPFVKQQQPNKPDTKTILKHLALFITTFITVSLAGAAFVGFEPSIFPASLPTLSDFYRGMIFAGLLLGFLGVHEFGHYFAALYHRVKVTLPYFIPIPLGIGTIGAVIRIKQKINDTRKMFDV